MDVIEIVQNQQQEQCNPLTTTASTITTSTVVSTASQTQIQAAPAPVVAANITAVPAVAPSVVTIPVPVVQNEDNYTYVSVKGSLHDRSCAVFGLNDAEILALTKRFDNVKQVVNGVMVSVPPMLMINTLAQLNYKVICSSGEAEICWTMQREI